MVTPYNMDTLTSLFSSRGKAQLLRLLFGLDERRLHVREIERQSGLALGTVQQELKRLAGLGIIGSQSDGNRRYYTANREHPLYPDLRNIVLKTSGLADVLRQALSHKAIQVAFVFGSIARGEEEARSDIDLMIIGAIGLRQVSRLLAGAGEKLGREINPHTFTEQEFRRRKKSRDHFLASTLSSPRLYITGSDHELEAMG